jgi:hypothetical protein
LEGKLEGKQDEARALVMRQLVRRFGSLSSGQSRQHNALSLEQIEALAEISPVLKISGNGCPVSNLE